MVALIQYDADLAREIVTQLQSNLYWHVTDANIELLADGDVLVLETPGDKFVEPREEAALNERILPQSNSGVWVRIVDSEPFAAGLSLDEGITTHTVEVHTWVNVQDRQPDTTVGSASAGYVQAAYLARAVDDCIMAHMTGNCAAGIVSIVHVPGPRIPTPLKKLPSVHVILTTYEIMQRTAQPSP